ncbi:MAG: methionyl-tRNA formyltransferase [Vicinamibacteria bacterium]|nr:methionyl-tRNA formyltransferase [Vicinamibacteria bacterium]
MFVGSKALGARALETLHSIAPETLSAVVTIDDSRDVRCALSRFKDFAARTGKPLRVLGKGSDLESAIGELKPDLCLVVGWYWILKPALLRAVPRGWLGIHASLLPRYRGSSPLVWAILNGDKTTGLSLFYFDEGMDTGDIVAQRTIEIGPTDDIGRLLARIEEETIGMLEEQYPALIAATAPRVPQDGRQASYVAARVPEDGQIDWTASATTVHDFIRAQTHPYPGAFFRLGDRVVRVWTASVFAFPCFGSPGQVVMTQTEGVVVACGQGSAVVLRTVQADDDAEQPASTLLRYGQRLA